MPIQANQQDSFFGANFHQLATKKSSATDTKDFCEKMHQKLPDFEENISKITAVA
jgi:hypothetical protein